MRSTAAYGWLRRARTRARFGDVRRTQPLTEWGNPRGKPVDRWYIERFLEEHADAVRGAALEVKNDMYSTRFGAATVDVVDIDDDNPEATVLGDLCLPGTLRPEAYDVAIVTQTLQLVRHPVDAVRNVLAALRPNGSLLITVPTLSRLVDASDRWRWTPAGLADVLHEAAPDGATVHTVGLGNGLAGRAFLFGLAVEDLDDDVLSRTDPHYPLVVGGAVCLPT